MASLNSKAEAPKIYTGEGGPAKRITPLQELIRLTMACLLWEDGFYESGKAVGARIRELVHQVSLAEAASVAIEAREGMKLRHVPLLIVREMARHPWLSKDEPKIVSETLARVIQRADELTEFLAIYWADGKQPLSKQVKLGLAKAFSKFNEYELAKYNRDKDIKLRDVLFLCHSKPKDAGGTWTKASRAAYKAAQGNGAAITKVLNDTGHEMGDFSPGEMLYGKLIYDQLVTPDTWEVELSKSTDKTASWNRLLDEKKLGDLAFLRNLRNMVEAGIGTDAIVSYGDGRNWGRVLPFRFISAARVVPQLEPHLERWMFKCLKGSPKLPGRTFLLCDLSSSMDAKLSGKSDLRRVDAMRALAMLLREVCEEVYIVPFTTEAWEAVPPRRGFALVDLLDRKKQGFPDGTYLGKTVEAVNRARDIDRLIVITDEQTADRVPNPVAPLAYMLNVAANKNGVGYGRWLHIDGFSEAVVGYIQKYEGSL